MDSTQTSPSAVLYPECALKSGESTTQFAERIMKFISDFSAGVPDTEKQEVEEKARLYFEHLLSKIESTANPGKAAKQKWKWSKRHLKDRSRVLFLEALYGLKKVVRECSWDNLWTIDFSPRAMELIADFEFTNFTSIEGFQDYFNKQDTSEESWNQVKMWQFLSTISGATFLKEEDKIICLNRLFNLRAIKSLEWSKILLEVLVKIVESISDRELKIHLLQKFNDLPTVKDRVDRRSSRNNPWKTLFYQPPLTSPAKGTLSQIAADWSNPMYWK